MEKCLTKTNCLAFYFVAFGLLLLSSSGCSDRQAGLVKVSGTVLIDGKPLQHGVVRIVPADQRASVGRLNEFGEFTLGCFEIDDGAYAGNHQVEIAATTPIGSNGLKWWAPKKYARTSDSGLSVEITGPTNELLIEISWEGGKPFVEKF